MPRPRHRHPPVPHQNVRKQARHLGIPLVWVEMTVFRLVQEVGDVFLQEEDVLLRYVIGQPVGLKSATLPQLDPRKVSRRLQG